VLKEASDIIGILLQKVIWTQSRELTSVKETVAEANSWQKLYSFFKSHTSDII